MFNRQCTFARFHQVKVIIEEQTECYALHQNLQNDTFDLIVHSNSFKFLWALLSELN